LVTPDAATIAVVVALALGWNFAWFRRCNRAAAGAKRDFEGAKRNASKARAAMAFIAVVGALVIRAWLRGSGRG
jgi:hypothetical protein